MDIVLIAFINKPISIIFKMMSYTTGFKPKGKQSATELQPQFMTSYALDNNRKSIANHNPLPKVTHP